MFLFTQRSYNTIYLFTISILVILFAYSGMVKYADYNGFTSAMYNQPFSQSLTQLLIYTLPVTELITAALLVFNRTRLAGIILALLQMIVFTVYTIMVLLNYYDAVPCPCGGFIQDLSWQQHLFLNVSLSCLCLIALALHRFIIIKHIHEYRESRTPV
jgi:putative oxidoreductase